MIHIEPVVLICRKFKDGDEWGDEYEGVMTIQKIGDVGFCAGAHGEVSIRDFRELERSLKKYGISKLKWTRK
jgi:hypothetical protein